MFSSRIIVVILFCAGLFCLAQAQVPQTGAGLGAPASTAAYSGPGDVVSGALVYYGLRGYNAAFNSKVINVCDQATGSTCADATWASGVLTIPTIGGNPCDNASHKCVINTFYDQSGGNNCVGATPCDISQATNASRAVLVVNQFNGKPCALFSGAQNYQITAGYVAQSSPYTFVAEVERTGAFTSAGAWMHSNNYSGFFDTSVNTVGIFAGTSTVDATASDSALHSVIQFSGTSGNNIVDGVAGTPGNAGTGATGNTLFVGTDALGGSDALTGYFCEGGEWPVQFNATQYGNMNTNQAAYW